MRVQAQVQRAERSLDGEAKSSEGRAHHSVFLTAF